MGTRVGEAGEASAEAGKDRVEFFIAQDARDVVACGGAEDAGVLGADVQGKNASSRDGCESVAVVEAEGRQAVAAPQEGEGIPEAQRPLMHCVPLLHARLMAIAGRLVKGTGLGADF